MSETTDPTDPTDAAATTTGSVLGCWRYPVKSFQGLELRSLDIGPTGVLGDRTYGVMPDGVDRVLSAKTERALLDASADDEGMTLPDGRRLSHRDPEADAVLSEWLGKPVHLARAADQSGKTLSYAMTFDPPNDDADLFDIPMADGSFLDLAHVHLVTTATLAGCADAYPDLNWDVRRFRPNLLLDVDAPTFVEQEWIGRHVQVGSAVLEVSMPTVRCAMPLRAQPGGLDRQPGLFKAMNELNQVSPNHLGVYCSVVTPGLVTAGDAVSLV